MRSSGHDDRAGKERGAAAQKLDQGRHIKYHIVGVPILNRDAVENRFDLKAIWIGDFIRRDQRNAGIDEWPSG